MIGSGFKLHRRIGLVIAAVVLVNSTVFAIVALAIAYAVEDRQFVQALDDEIARQQASWERAGTVTDPGLRYISIYRSPRDLPSDLKDQVQAERDQIEFRGLEGRHYHVARFRLAPDDAATSAFAVAEVSRYLFIRPALGSIVIFLALLGGSIALVTGLLGFVLARRALAPLGELASQVGSGNTPVPRIDSTRYPPNEIGMLASQLSSAFERIGGFIAREQAFTREASHELRTPIAVIRGSAEIVALQAGLSAASVASLRRIDTATQDMVNTLDLLLDLAREEAGTARERIVLRPIIVQAVEDVRERFPDTSIETKIFVEPDAAIVAHKTLLQLIINNLIANSFAHSRAHRLDITFADDQLTITDDGVGMEMTDRSKERTDREGPAIGGGLGLLIVQRLCEAGGLRFTIVDSAPGAGTRVSVQSAPGANETTL